MSISYIPNQQTYKEMTPFKRFVLQSFPWIDANFDALTNYELMGKIIEYLNDIISNENAVQSNVTSLHNAYTELYNYFNNLDVQDEINHKLDVMAQSGQLSALIGEYIDDEIIPLIDAQNVTLNTAINTQNQRISEVEEEVTTATSGSPAGVYATVDALTTANPDHSKIYLVIADGKWYYYNTTSSAWAAGGVYQASSFPEVSDIRTAWNRIIYDSAGDSVRAQVKNNNDIIKQIVIEHRSRNYYNKNDITVDDNQYLSNPIYVEPGDHFYFCGHLNNKDAMVGLSCWGCIFYDGAMNPLSVSANWITQIVVPDNDNIVFMKVKFPEINYQYIMFEKDVITRQYEEYYEPYYTIADTSIVQQLNEINAKINNLNNEEFVLPTKLYGCINQEYNVYYQNILKYSDKNVFAGCNITGSLADCEKLSDRLIWKPTNTGQTDITVNLYKDNWNDLIKSRNVKMVCAPQNTGSSTISTIIIGDSKIAYGQVVRYLSQLFEDDQMTLNLLGSRYDNNNTGDPTYKHDGFGGWSTFNFVHSASVNGVTNPFYNPSTNVFDFDYYMTNQQYDSVDYLFILLGTNDFETSASEIIADTNIMINSIKSFNSNIKIIIGLNEGVYFPKKEWQSRNNKFFDFNKAKIQAYENQIENVYVLPLYVNIDLYQDFPLQNVPLSQADQETNSGKTRIYCADGIHQNNVGFYKFAQTIYGFIKCDKSSLL